MNMNGLPNILIVDDLPENLSAMKRILSKLPANLITASSGEEALKLLVRQKYALALLDVQMPQMDGFELADLMSNNSTTEKTPIIFITALNHDEHNLYKGYGSGCVDYLIKPLNDDHLIAKVKVFLSLYKHSLHAENIEKNLAMLLNNVADGYWDWQVGTNQFYNSVQFKKALGYQEEEVENRLETWISLMTKEHIQKATEMLSLERMNQTFKMSLNFEVRSRLLLFIADPIMTDQMDIFHLHHV